MEIDDFIATIDIRQVSMKACVAMYVQEKSRLGLGGGVTLAEVINLQTAYIDSLREALFSSEDK